MDKTQKFIISLTFFVVVIIGMAILTQITAAELDYDPVLSKEGVIFSAEDVVIYNPFAYIKWRSLYRSYYPNVFGEGMKTICYILMTAILATFLVRALLFKGNKDSFGSARFSTLEELKKMNLFTPKGVFLGAYGNKFLRDYSFTHLLLVSPTRGGKSINNIIPTALTWPHSVVFTDVKGELWNLSAGCRKYLLGNKVIKFEPTSLNSAHFNFLAEIRIRTEFEIMDVQNILTIMGGQKMKDPNPDFDHWLSSAQSLLTCVIIHVLYVNPKASINDVIDYMFGEATFLVDDVEEESMSDDEIKSRHCASVKERLMYAREYLHDPEKTWFKSFYEKDTATHPTVIRIANDMISRADKEFSSIVSTASTILRTYYDPLLAKNLSSSDFTIDDLVNYEKPVSLYLVTPPSDIDRLSPVFNLIVELFFKKLTETHRLRYENFQPVSNFKHRLLLMLDEFAELGRLKIMQNALSFCAVYGIKCFVVCQDPNQLNRLYSADNSIVANCQIQIYHTPNDYKTAKLISDNMGNKTIDVVSRSYSNNIVNAVGPRSHNVSSIRRKLMEPDEILAMPEDKELIFIRGQRPIYADKFKYYELSVFKKLLRWPPKESDSLYRAQESEENNIKTLDFMDIEALVKYADEPDNTDNLALYAERRNKG